jgi:hypothetical protein
VTQDLDQSLELIGAVIALLFILPFLMAWLEDSLQQRTSVDRQSLWQSLKPYLPTRWGSRGRR